MTNRERCDYLKKIRQKIADRLGIDLHQTECTYEGECDGTCPKCQQEEDILNEALNGTSVSPSVKVKPDREVRMGKFVPVKDDDLYPFEGEVMADDDWVINEPNDLDSER